MIKFHINKILLKTLNIQTVKNGSSVIHRSSCFSFFLMRIYLPDTNISPFSPFGERITSRNRGHVGGAEAGHGTRRDMTDAGPWALYFSALVPLQAVPKRKRSRIVPCPASAPPACPRFRRPLIRLPAHPFPLSSQISPLAFTHPIFYNVRSKSREARAWEKNVSALMSAERR